MVHEGKITYNSKKEDDHIKSKNYSGITHTSRSPSGTNSRTSNSARNMGKSPSRKAFRTQNSSEPGEVETNGWKYYTTPKTLRKGYIKKIMIETLQKRIGTDWNGSLHTNNVWIWAEPGIGKSRWANQQQSMTATLNKNYNKWLCGCSWTDTRLVIIEDWPCKSQGNTLV
jgi:hypothetical protein